MFIPRISRPGVLLIALLGAAPAAAALGTDGHSIDCGDHWLSLTIEMSGKTAAIAFGGDSGADWQRDQVATAYSGGSDRKVYSFDVETGRPGAELTVTFDADGWGEALVELGEPGLDGMIQPCRLVTVPPSL